MMWLFWFGVIVFGLFVVGTRLTPRYLPRLYLTVDRNRKSHWKTTPREHHKPLK